AACPAVTTNACPLTAFTMPISASYAKPACGISAASSSVAANAVHRAKRRGPTIVKECHTRVIGALRPVRAALWPWPKNGGVRCSPPCRFTPIYSIGKRPDGVREPSNGQADAVPSLVHRRGDRRHPSAAGTLDAQSAGCVASLQSIPRRSERRQGRRGKRLGRLYFGQLQAGRERLSALRHHAGPARYRQGARAIRRQILRLRREQLACHHPLLGAADAVVLWRVVFRVPALCQSA